jgi:hypothetical protein
MMIFLKNNQTVYIILGFQAVGENNEILYFISPIIDISAQKAEQH